MGSCFLGYEVCVISVGAGDSMVFVGAASIGNVGSAAAASVAAVTLTEAGGAAVETGRRGATPCGRTGGSWEGSMVGRDDKGARPGRWRGGSDARGGTDGDRSWVEKVLTSAFTVFKTDLVLTVPYSKSNHPIDGYETLYV